jgi:hypothetical protein
MKTKLFLTGLALMAATVMVSAQQGNGNGNGRCKSANKGAAYVDKNKNGVCDNAGNQQGKTTANKGKGKGDGTMKGQGKNRNFVDANNNGICDKNETNTKK